MCGAVACGLSLALLRIFRRVSLAVSISVMEIHALIAVFIARAIGVGAVAVFVYIF
jgi:hypothetical protein